MIKCILFSGALLAVDPPSYTRYYAEGLLKLPYAELSEPFMVYYDFNNTRSKISFYNGNNSCNSYIKYFQ